MPPGFSQREIELISKILQDRFALRSNKRIPNLLTFYLRVDYNKRAGAETARVMSRLYAAARLHVNFFQPSFKLREKRREGAKVIKRYHAPATPYERALAHPKLLKAIKRRLRETYCTLDPVALLAEIRAAQEILGERIGKRGLAATTGPLQAHPRRFEQSLGSTEKPAEVRATHRRPNRRYKKRIRMPSKLDPHLATIESWVATELQFTALAIAHDSPRLILQRLASSSIRSCSACCEPCAGIPHSEIAEVAAEGYENVAQPPGTVDGSGYAGPDPPTAPLPVPAFTVDPSDAD